MKVAVVGGGAAGLTAALAAGYSGARVTVLERKERVGKKILATGNGRCNLSNIDLDIHHYHGLNPKFAFGALHRFDFHKTMDFFERLGVAWKVEDGGRVFPMSGQASSVLDVMRHELEVLGVATRCQAGVTGVSKKKDKFFLQLKTGDFFQADRVVIAAGGRAAPNLGSNGSGYDLARQAGHRIVDPFPALVQLKLNADFLKQISGVKFDGRVEILVNGKTKALAAGEILFTNYGISGPPVLALSRVAGEHWRRGEGVSIKVVMMDHYSREALERFLIDRLKQQAHKTVHFSFVGFINKRLIPVVLKEAGIKELNKPAGEITAGEKSAIVEILQNWRLEVAGTNSWPAAQVTAGGVDVRDVHPQTMESKRVPGLYFAGEILDIDGDCGGYNLQWAWSSGYVAGASAAAIR